MINRTKARSTNRKLDKKNHLHLQPKCTLDAIYMNLYTT